MFDITLMLDQPFRTFGTVKNAVDQARKQELINDINEGELILKTGKIHGRKMSQDELERVQRTINSSKRKLEQL